MRVYQRTLKSQDDNGAVVKNIMVQINAQVNIFSTESVKATRDQVFDPKNQEIATDNTTDKVLAIVVR